MWGNFRNYVMTKPNKVLGFFKVRVVPNLLRILLTSLETTVAILFTAANPIITVTITAVGIGVSWIDDIRQMHIKKTLVHSRERTLRHRENPYFITDLVKLGLFIISGISLFGYIHITLMNAATISSMNSVNIVPNTTSLVSSYILVGLASTLLPIGRWVANSYINKDLEKLDNQILDKIEKGNANELNLEELRNINFLAPAVLTQLSQENTSLDPAAALQTSAIIAEGQNTTLIAERNTARRDLEAAQITIRKLGGKLETYVIQIETLIAERNTARRALEAAQMTIKNLREKPDESVTTKDAPGKKQEDKIQSLVTHRQRDLGSTLQNEDGQQQSTTWEDELHMVKLSKV